MLRVLSFAALGLCLGGVGCASFSGAPTNFEDVCSADAADSIQGTWTVVGINGRQVAEYFPTSTLQVSQDNIWRSSAQTGHGFGTQSGILTDDERDGFERAGACYSLKNGKLEIRCPSAGIVPAKVYGKHNRSIYNTQGRLDEIWQKRPLYITRLGNRLCASSDDGETIEYVLREQ